MRAMVHEIGGRLIPLSYSDPVERLRTLRWFLEARPPAFLAVDGHGPYYRIGAPFANLARSLSATVVPCAALARPHVTFPALRVRVSIPVPRSRLMLVLGRPEELGKGAKEPPLATVRSLEARMNHVRECAVALFGWRR
jgi:lysophospholipid acyltransferase (LPLAT)-like uncharacterized protein